MLLNVAQVRVMGKIMRYLSYMDDLWKNNGSGRCTEESRVWNDFEEPHLLDDRYNSVLTVIMAKAGKIRKEGKERIS